MKFTGWELLAIEHSLRAAIEGGSLDREQGAALVEKIGWMSPTKRTPREQAYAKRPTAVIHVNLS